MKIDDRYERLENDDLYDELSLPIRIHDNIDEEYKNDEEEK